MIPHDILTLYSAKMLEYGIAVLFLLLFIPFWRYVQGPAKALDRLLAFWKDGDAELPLLVEAKAMRARLTALR